MASDSKVKGSPATPSAACWLLLPVTSLSAPRVLRICKEEGRGRGRRVGAEAG